MIRDLKELLPTEGHDESVIAAPKALKKKILKRIAVEPARVTTDRNGCITSINPAFCELCGYSFDEVRGKKPGVLLQGADSEPESVNILRKAVRDGTPCTAEILNYHKDGRPYRVRIEMEPIKNNNGLLIGFRAKEIKIA